MTMYKEALEFATEKHKGQTRWDGGDYIRHPKGIADKFSDDLRKTVAILHDVVEDTDAELSEIKERFGGQVASAVDALTKRSGETYKDFIRRSAKNAIAKDIKIADIENNMGDIPPDDEEMKKKAKSLRTKRYIPALLFLKGKSEEL